MYTQGIQENSYCSQLGLCQPNYLLNSNNISNTSLTIPLNNPVQTSSPDATASTFMNFFLFMYMMKNYDKFNGLNTLSNNQTKFNTNSNSYENISRTSHSRKTHTVEDVEDIEDVEETEPIKETSNTEKAKKAEEVKKTEEAKKVKEAEEKEKAVKALETSQEKAQADFDKSKKQQGFIGKSWNWMKNSLGASSEKVKEEEIEGKGGFGHWARKQWSKVVDSDNGSKAIQKKMDDSKEKIKEAKKDPKKLEEAYTKVNNDIDKYEDIFLKGKKHDELTEEEKTCFEEIKKELGDKGLDVSRNDLRKAIQSAINKDSETTVEKQIIAKSEDTEGEGLKLNTAQKVEDFKSSQEAGVDTIASIANGLVIAAAIAASPFTFGASLAIAIPAGAALKVGLKYADCKTAEEPKDYDSLGSDLLTGSIDGLAAGLFPGGSSAITTSAAKMLGLQATKTVTKKVATETAEAVAKETAENIVKTSAKGSWLKNLFLKPTLSSAEKGVVNKSVNTLTVKGLERTSEQVGKIIAKDGQIIAQDAAEKTLGSVITAAKTDGTAIVTSTIDDISKAEARRIGWHNTTSHLAKNGITESVEYGIKDAKYLPGMLLNAVDKTGAGRKFVAKGIGQTMMGGNIGATYAGANSITRGDDLMTVLENTGDGWTAGAMFGGGLYAGSKFVGKSMYNRFGSKTPKAGEPTLITAEKPSIPKSMPKLNLESEVKELANRIQTSSARLENLKINKFLTTLEQKEVAELEKEIAMHNAQLERIISQKAITSDQAIQENIIEKSHSKRSAQESANAEESAQAFMKQDKQLINRLKRLFKKSEKTESSKIKPEEVIETPVATPNVIEPPTVAPEVLAAERNIARLGLKTRVQLYWADLLDKIDPTGKFKSIQSDVELMGQSTIHDPALFNQNTTALYEKFSELAMNSSEVISEHQQGVINHHTQVTKNTYRNQGKIYNNTKKSQGFNRR